MPGDTIEIAAAADERYAMPMAAMLASVQRGLEPAARVRAHLLSVGLSPRAKRRIEASVDERRMRIVWVDVAASALARRKLLIRSTDHVSVASYARLLLPDLLDRALGRVVYLDADVVCLDSVRTLWEADFAGRPLLAVPEVAPAAATAGAPGGIRAWRELGLAPDLTLLNAGVLVFDLRQWRERQLARQAFHYLARAHNYVRWHDQEAINVVLRGQWQPLPARWNVSTFCLGRAPAAEVIAALGRPSIIHYTSARKPWQAGYDLAFRDAFFDALDATPWRGWRPRAGPMQPLAGFGQRLTKAVRKRGGEMLRRRELRRRRRAGLRQLRGESAASPVAPVRQAREIRAFCVAARSAEIEAETLQPMLVDGVDRIVIAAPAGAEDRLASDPRVIVVVAGDEAPDLTLRRLLYRYGEGHWCLNVAPGWSVHAPERDLTSVGAVCDYLQRSGRDALVCRDVAAARTLPATAIECDPLSGHLLSGPAVLDAMPAPATTPLRYAGRMALFRYARGLAVAANTTLVAAAQPAEFTGQLRRLADDPQDAVPAPRL
ncbi:MAG: glycosyltransferase [Pseudomonadota bacterium]